MVLLSIVFHNLPVVAYASLLKASVTRALSVGCTPFVPLLTHLSTAWARWKSQSSRKHWGWTAATAPSSAELLSIIKNRGFQSGFHFLRMDNPSVMSSSFSYCGIIVPTTRPMPIDVRTTRKKQGKPYFNVLCIASIHVTSLPYRSNHSFCFFVCRTSRKLSLWP